MELPHYDYFDAVLDALHEAGLPPHNCFAESPDGTRLEAVFTWTAWTSGLNREELPHGVLIIWTQFDGWEYAPLRGNGYNEDPAELCREFIPSPASLVEVVRQLMQAPETMPGDGRPWAKAAELERALEEWED
ncbi:MULTISPECIES: hypothetical protein [Actinosynnema]|uniref:hypothetical protein n=1 Tax=Actinosynnema TaxID=40566 RepID=UPI0020A35FA2|nr:hypothetical protein [Actinosynnema pretiosum]MCP2098990.1 hypothetical protein [Actinosynnema pretiosum]